MEYYELARELKKRGHPLAESSPDDLNVLAWMAEQQQDAKQLLSIVVLEPKRPRLTNDEQERISGTVDQPHLPVVAKNIPRSWPSALKNGVPEYVTAPKRIRHRTGLKTNSLKGPAKKLRKAAQSKTNKATSRAAAAASRAEAAAMKKEQLVLWRCAWCDCSSSETHSRRRGPDGALSLCACCGARHSRGAGPECIREARNL